MNKKQYITPQLRILAVQPARMLALSIIEGATADQNSDVLVKQNDWDIFGEDAADDSSDASFFE